MPLACAGLFLSSVQLTRIPRRDRDSTASLMIVMFLIVQSLFHKKSQRGRAQPSQWIRNQIKPPPPKTGKSVRKIGNIKPRLISRNRTAMKPVHEILVFALLIWSTHSLSITNCTQQKILPGTRETASVNDSLVLFAIDSPYDAPNAGRVGHNSHLSSFVTR